MDVSSRLTHPNQCTYLLSIQYTFNLNLLSPKFHFMPGFFSLVMNPAPFLLLFSYRSEGDENWEFGFVQPPSWLLLIARCFRTSVHLFDQAIYLHCIFDSSKQIAVCLTREKCKIGRDWNLIAGGMVVKGNQKWRWIVSDQSGKGHEVWWERGLLNIGQPTVHTILEAI